MDKAAMCKIEVSTWIGVAGNASHWMGKLVYRDGRGYEFVKLTRILTSKDAKEENRNHKKAWPGYYSNPDLAWGKNPFCAGQVEDRFTTKADLVEAAKAKYVELGLLCGLVLDNEVIIEATK